MFLRSRIPGKHPSAAILGEERRGAGVAVAPNRVLTAHYLVLGANRIEAIGADGKEREAHQAALDHETGLAVLALQGPGLRPASMTRTEEVKPGLPVFLLSCTSETERKGASGHVSAVEPFEAFWEYMLDEAILTTVINPGLAGAPLFDLEGRLIGLVSLGLAAVGRYSLAIPLDLYLRHRQEMEDEGGGARPRRAWVGFYPQSHDGGVMLSGVVPRGPADKAGMARGDHILTVEGEPVATLRKLYQEIWKKAPGETLRLQVLRDSAIQHLEVVAGDRYEFFK